MTVWIKQGCCGDFKPEIRKAIGKLHDHYYRNFGIDLYITSIRDGNHIAGSLHYDGFAVDLGRDPQHEIERFQSILGITTPYQILFREGHIHIEYDYLAWIKTKRN